MDTKKLGFRAVFLYLLIAFGLMSHASARGLFSKKDDIGFGKSAAEEIESQLTINENPRINRRLMRIAQRLVEVEPQKYYQFHFKIVDDKELNAFALPGGFIYINSGVFDRAGNDDGVIAAILGHEMGHVIARHGMKQLEKALGGSFILSILLGDSELGQAAADVILGTIMNGYSQDDEYEADHYGVHLSYLAGYGVSSARRMLQMILDEYGDSNLPKFLMTHPKTSDRIAKAAEFETYLTDVYYRDNPPVALQGYDQGDNYETVDTNDDDADQPGLPEPVNAIHKPGKLGSD